MKKAIIVEFVFVTRIVIDEKDENPETVVALSRDNILDKAKNELAENLSEWYDDEDMSYMENEGLKKKEDVELLVLSCIHQIGMDKPTNFDSIVRYVYEDVCETADPDNWSTGDVVIGFRRWIESREGQS